MILTNHSSFFEELGLTSFTTQQNSRKSRIIDSRLDQRYDRRLARLGHLLINQRGD
jgi:hypothetical protein